ncbi:hypothetical protein GIW81_04490 [Hyphomicrobium sp. xq]|uniref:Uncharacterized protein n=1 Tax=Hyphomicrobium album TaxID=2665159 RepID=A0A6I3KLK1_9HYPH|nr:hypothetical protein [Hyphomicrobium album]MTD93591.1 hypothetical protein [Hyphomicrobium album]
MTYPGQSPQVPAGTLFSKMMVTIIVLTTLALISFGPKSITSETFGGRAGTHDTAIEPSG